MQLENRNITVAVYMITYNHEDYIQQAIDSVLMQKTDFKYKLFIGEDLSTDNTRKICVELAKQYSNKIELFLHPNNIGAVNNAQVIYRKCFDSGAKYIAMLEGDDYWTDPYKLQKQVDFLEANEDYVMHYFNARIVDEKGKMLSPIIFNSDSRSYAVEDLLRGTNPICTLTTMFRNIAQIKEPLFKEVLFQYPFGDWAMWIFLVHHSKLKIKFDSDVMASYRKHSGGICSGAAAHINAEKSLLVQQLNLKYYPEYSPSILEGITFSTINLVKAHLSFNKIKGVNFYFKNYSKFKGQFSLRDLVYALRKY